MTAIWCAIAVGIVYGVYYICGRAIEYGKKEGIVDDGRKSDD